MAAIDTVQVGQPGSVPGLWFLWFDVNGRVWNPTLGTPAYEAWQDGHYSQYRVAGTQIGTTQLWSAARPAGIREPFYVAFRRNTDGTLANDQALGRIPHLTSDQTYARELFGVSGTSTAWHVSIGGNDSSDGFSFGTGFATIAHAISQAVAGDFIYVSRGTFAQGNAVLSLPDGVALVGAGIDLTFITSTADLVLLGCIVRPGTGSQVADMTIQGVAASGTYQSPLGSYSAAITPQAAFTNVTLRRLKLIADSNGLYIDQVGSLCSAVGRDLIIQAKGTGVVLSANTQSTLDLYDPTIDVTGPSTVTATASRGIAGTTLSQGTVRTFDGQISVTGGTATNRGVETNGLTVHLVRTKLSITGNGATDLVSQGAGSQLTIQDVAYNNSTGGVGVRNTDVKVSSFALPLLDANGLLMVDVEDARGAQIVPAGSALFAGGGALPMTVNVKDLSSGVNIAAAIVRISGAQAAYQVTDNSGNAALSLNSGNATLSITANNYSAYNPVVHAISIDGHWDGGASATLNVTLTPITTLSPGLPNQIVGTLFTRKPDDTTQPAVVVQFQLTGPPPGEGGSDYDDTIFSVTSDGTGLVSYPFTKGAAYQYKNLKGAWIPFTAPTTGTMFAIADGVGKFAG